MNQPQTAEQHNAPHLGHSALRSTCRTPRGRFTLPALPPDREFFDAMQALLDMHVEGDHERAEQISEGLVKLERRRRLEAAGHQLSTLNPQPEPGMADGCCDVCGENHQLR